MNDFLGFLKRLPALWREVVRMVFIRLERYQVAPVTIAIGIAPSNMAI